MGDSIGFIFAEIDQSVRRILNELEEGCDYSIFDGRLRIHVDRQVWRAASIAARVTSVSSDEEKSFAHILESHRNNKGDN